MFTSGRSGVQVYFHCVAPTSYGRFQFPPNSCYWTTTSPTTTTEPSNLTELVELADFTPVFLSIDSGLVCLAELIGDKHRWNAQQKGLRFEDQDQALATFNLLVHPN
jgi:hypothetical protein